MSELNEMRVRELVRDEMSSMLVPQRLAAIEAVLEHKADKADVEKLRTEIKSEMSTFKESVINEMSGVRERMSSLEAKLDANRDLNKNNFRILIGFIIAIFLLLVKIVFFPNP